MLANLMGMLTCNVSQAVEFDQVPDTDIPEWRVLSIGMIVQTIEITISSCHQLDGMVSIRNDGNLGQRLPGGERTGFQGY